MGNRNNLFIMASFVFVFIFINNPVNAVTSIFNCGQPLTSGDLNILMNNVSTTGSSCLQLSTSDTILDLNGKTITMNGCPSGYAIRIGQYASDNYNSVIRNGHIRLVNNPNCYGIWLDTQFGASIYNTTISNVTIFAEPTSYYTYGILGGNWYGSIFINYLNLVNTTIFGLNTGLQIEAGSYGKVYGVWLNSSTWDIYFGGISNAVWGYNVSGSCYNASKVYSVAGNTTIESTYCPPLPPSGYEPPVIPPEPPIQPPLSCNVIPIEPLQGSALSNVPMRFISGLVNFVFCNPRLFVIMMTLVIFFGIAVWFKKK